METVLSGIWQIPKLCPWVILRTAIYSCIIVEPRMHNLPTADTSTPLNPQYHSIVAVLP